MGLKNKVVSAVETVDSGWDLAKFYVRRNLGRYKDLHIVGYRGYGNQEMLHLQGRVMRNPKMVPAEADWSTLRNLRSGWKRFMTDEVPYARIEVYLNGHLEHVRATREGYFALEIGWPGGSPAAETTGTGGWHKVDLVLPANKNPNRQDLHDEAEVLVPSRKARFGVISDIDDTVLETNATSFLKMLKVTILQNAHTRLAFPGAAALYHGLKEGPGGQDENPLFYVSNSPWNLYDFLDEFFRHKNMPRGPFLLRDFSLRTAVFKHETQWAHKIGAIRQILDFYPDLPFVLIGDTGEGDPEIFREIARSDPSRIRAIIVRRAQHKPRDQAMWAMSGEIGSLGIPFCLAPSSLEAAEFSAAQGLVAPDLPERVAVDRAQEKELPVV